MKKRRIVPMLTFEEKIALIEENFPELQRKDVSLGRLNYHFEESVQEKSNVVYHLHPNGNGFVYAGYLAKNDKNDKGYINIRDYSAEALVALIKESIESLSKVHGWQQPKKEAAIERKEEQWIGPNRVVLTLVGEDEMWYVFDEDSNLEAAFETFAEAEGYLKEEGFKPKF